MRRVVASGNGAAYYVAVALWLASLEGPVGPDVVAVPSGLLARGGFAWRPGDVLLAVSSSGEFRDLVEAVDAGAPRAVRGRDGQPGLDAWLASRGARARRRCRTSVPSRTRRHSAAQSSQHSASGPRSLLTRASDDALRRLPDELERTIAGARAWVDELGAVEARHGDRLRKRTGVGSCARSRAAAQGGRRHPGRRGRDPGGRDLGNDVAASRSTRAQPAGTAPRIRCSPRPRRSAQARGRGCSEPPAATLATAGSPRCRPSLRAAALARGWGSNAGSTSTGPPGRRPTTGLRDALHEPRSRRDRLRQRLRRAVSRNDRESASRGSRARGRRLRRRRREAAWGRGALRRRARPARARRGRRRARVDVVLVLTSMNEHGPLAKAALEAGRHVLVEKPMATSLAEAAELVELARALGGHSRLCAAHPSEPDLPRSPRRRARRTGRRSPHRPRTLRLGRPVVERVVLRTGRRFALRPRRLQRHEPLRAVRAGEARDGDGRGGGTRARRERPPDPGRGRRQRPRAARLRRRAVRGRSRRGSRCSDTGHLRSRCTEAKAPSSSSATTGPRRAGSSGEMPTGRGVFPGVRIRTGSGPKGCVISSTASRPAGRP